MPGSIHGYWRFDLRSSCSTACTLTHRLIYPVLWGKVCFVVFVYCFLMKFRLLVPFSGYLSCLFLSLGRLWWWRGRGQHLPWSQIMEMQGMDANRCLELKERSSDKRSPSISPWQIRASWPCHLMAPGFFDHVVLGCSLKLFLGENDSLESFFQPQKGTNMRRTPPPIAPFQQLLLTRQEAGIISFNICPAVVRRCCILCTEKIES